MSMPEMVLAVGVSAAAGLALMWLGLDVHRSVEDRRIENDALAIAISYGAREAGYAALVQQGLLSIPTLRDALALRGISHGSSIDAGRWCADFLGTRQQAAVAVGQCKETKDGLLEWILAEDRRIEVFDSLSRQQFDDLNTKTGTQ